MEKHARFSASNRLLALLEPAVSGQLEPTLELVFLTLKQELQGPQAPMSHVYFPLTAVCSVLLPTDNGGFLEVATVGREGMVGLPIFLGSDTMPTTTVVQIPGEAMRMPSGTLRQAVREMGPLRDLLQRYVQAMFLQVAQSVVCNQEHDIMQRCARWLLMTQDRVGGDEFPLTQQFLSQMVGVRRASVNEVAVRLQQEGLITYHHGVITVLDRAGLQARSCFCYTVVRDEFERSLGVPG